MENGHFAQPDLRQTLGKVVQLIVVPVFAPEPLEVSEI